MSLLDAVRALTAPRRVRVLWWRLGALRHLRGHHVGRDVLVTGPLRVEASGGLRVGDGCRFNGGLSPTELVAAPGAELVLGEGCHLNYGCSLVAQRRVVLGKRCMLGSFVRLHDEKDGTVAPVVLGDDVWVAHGAVVEPGVTIGDGAVVSAGSVVTRDVPPRTMALGNPARVMSLELARRDG